MPEVEVEIVLTVLAVDEALQHMCALFRGQAARGEITPAERDLLIDGAILVAMRVDDELAWESRANSEFEAWKEARPKLAGRHERHAAAALADAPSGHVSMPG
jgi:hypothetical protein